MKWISLDAADECTLQFPKLTEDEIRNMTIGVYQLKTAKSYSSEHFTTDGLFEVLISDEIPDIVCVKIQSQHIIAKKYLLWVKYNHSFE